MGFILQGSGDPSILYESPMTSLPVSGAVVGAGGVTYNASGAVFDADTGLALDLTSLDLSALDTAGSYSFFVSNEAMGTNDALTGTAGINYATASYFVAHNETGLSTGSRGRSNVNPAGRISTQINNADAQNVAQVTTAGSPSLTTQGFYQVSWDGANNYSAWKNGRLLVNGAAATIFASGQFDYFWLGIDRGLANTTPTGITMGRFALSSLPITFTDSGAMMALGDSFFDGSPERSLTATANGPPLYDVTLGNEIQALERINNGGEYTYQNEGVGGENTAQILARTSAALIANDPKIVIIHAGTNDANTGVPVVGTQEADYLSILNLCIAHPSVEKVICENIITIKGNSTFDDAQGVTNVSVVNANILSAIASASSSKISHIDAFSAFGGESPIVSPTIDSTILGFQDTTQLDLHPSSQGEVIRAEAFFFAILSSAPTLTTPYGSTMYRFGNAAPRHGVSTYSYKNPNNTIAEATATDWFGGIGGINTKDIVYVQMSDGFATLSFTSPTTAALT